MAGYLMALSMRVVILAAAYLVPERKLGFFRESEADQLRMR